MRVIGWFLVVLLGAVAAVSVWPEAFGITQVPVLAQIVGMRPVVAIGLVVLAVLALLAGTAIRRGTRPRRLITLAVVFLLAAGGHVAVLASRGLDAGALPAHAEGDTTVFTLNLRKKSVEPEAVRDLVLDTGADVVVLTESDPAYARKVAALLADKGADYAAFPERDQTARGTTVLINRAYGAYRLVPTEEIGQVKVESVDGSRPTVIGVHPVSPPISFWRESAGPRTQRWARESDEAVEAAKANPGAIVAGDFNSTLDHAPLTDLGNHKDASVEAGIGARGTYPSTLPALLGTPIDHVLVPDGATVRGGTTVDVEDSDHRALVFRITGL